MAQIMTYIVKMIVYVILVWIMKIPAYSSFSDDIEIIPPPPVIKSDKPAEKPNIIILMADDLVNFNNIKQLCLFSIIFFKFSNTGME